MPHFTYSLILGDKSLEKLGPCLSPRYIQACSPAKCYVLFQADVPPPPLGEKYTILNQSTLWSAPCACLVPAATTQAFHLCFKVWQKECGGWEQGREGGQVEYRN